MKRVKLACHGNSSPFRFFAGGSSSLTGPTTSFSSALSLSEGSSEASALSARLRSPSSVILYCAATQ